MAAPKRKKSKPNPVETTTERNNDALAQSSNDVPALAPPPPVDPTTTPSAQPRIPDRSSWYSSWRSSTKSLPIAQIARESISVAQNTTSSTSEATPVRPPNSVSNSVRGSRKSIPLAAEATKVHAVSDASGTSRPRLSGEKDKEKGEREEAVDVKKESEMTEVPAQVVVEEARLPPEPAAVGGTDGAAEVGKGAWFAWWSRPDGYGSDGEKKGKSKVVKMDVEVEDATTTPLPGTPDEDAAVPGAANAMAFEGVSQAVDDGRGGAVKPEMKSVQSSSRGWFGLWSLAENQQAAESQQVEESTKQPPEMTTSAEPLAAKAAVVGSAPTKPEEPKPEASKAPQSANSSSGWAFWSTDKTKDPAPTHDGTQKQVGELAVADTPSQSHPEAAQFNEQRDQSTQSAPKPEVKSTASSLRPKRGKMTKALSTSDSSAAPTAVGSSSAAQTPTSEIPSPFLAPLTQQLDASLIFSRIPDQIKPAATKRERPNLILPSFASTFPLAPNPSYVERLTTYLAQSLHLLGSQTPNAPLHVYKTATLPKIRKAVALGVHGFFPTALVQKLIGQPKGTSIRFANYAASAIKSWCETNQPDSKNVEIEKVALEGEGYIADRVTTLWKLLLNWLSHLRQADLIIVACHSQGVPVAMMLVAKLIQLGCLAPNVRVGICAMAGINFGPFLEYRSRFFGGTALELFEFGDPKSAVSKAYAESLELCLRHGVRVTFAGSIDDQLVSLESALCTPVHHPYVMRAVFVDGRLHAPNFLTHLVVFAAKLRNLGVSDHGLIRELSAPLAGSLVGGEGHSRIYDEPDVYRLAIDFALESTDVQAPAPTATTTLAKAKAAARRSSTDLPSTLTLPTSPALAQHLRRSSISLSSASNNLPNSANPIAPITTPYEPPPSSATANPFYLPWAVRGMLEEELVKKDEGLREEVRALVREFEEWRPTSKVLKDVRWRLEGVRGMV